VPGGLIKLSSTRNSSERIASKFSSVVLIGSGVWFGALLIYVAVIDSPRYYTFAFGILLVLAVVSLKLPTSYKTKLAIALISTGGTLLFAEAILEIKGYASERAGARLAAAFWMQDNPSYDPRSQSEIINDLRKEGIDAYPFPSLGTLGRDFDDGAGEVFHLAVMGINYGKTINKLKSLALSVRRTLDASPEVLNGRD